MKNAKKSLSKIDEILGAGEKIKDIIFGLKLLVKENREQTSEFKNLLKSFDKIDTTNKEIKQLREDISSLKDVTERISQTEQKTSITNLPKTLKVKVTNPTKQKDVQAVEMKQPAWYKAFEPRGITDFISKALSKVLSVNVQNRDASEAVPVKLVHNREFYKSIGSAVVNGTISAFAENGKSVEHELVDGKIQADIISVPDGLSTEAKQDDTIELIDGVLTEDKKKVNTYGYIVDEYGNQSPILGDNIFKGSIIAIPPEHHEIHCGDSYEGAYTGDLGNGASVTFGVIIPNEGLDDQGEEGSDQTAKQYHAKIKIDVESEALVQFYEGATLSANGTSLGIINKNRNSLRTDYLGFFITPTVTDNGTLLPLTTRLGSTRTVGGEYSREDEMILKDNTIYLITITNQVTTNNYYNIKLDYYIHPGV
jgi:hypothetical protein